MASGAQRHDYYAILDIPHTATTENIKTSYKLLVLKRHPDKDKRNPNATAAFQLLQTAYETLIDPVQKRAYDFQWHKIRNQARKGEERQQAEADKARRRRKERERREQARREYEKREEELRILEHKRGKEEIEMEGVSKETLEQREAEKREQEYVEWEEAIRDRAMRKIRKAEAARGSLWN